MIKNGEKTCSEKKAYVYKSYLGVFSFAERRERRVKRKLCALAVGGQEVHLVSVSYEGNSSSFQTRPSWTLSNEKCILYSFAIVWCKLQGLQHLSRADFSSCNHIASIFSWFFFFSLSNISIIESAARQFAVENVKLWADGRESRRHCCNGRKKRSARKKHRVAANHDEFFNYNCCCCCWVKSPQGTMTRELLNVAAREEKKTIIIAKRKVIDAQQRTQSKTWCTYCDDKN